jgi:hypothetical protein
MIWPVLWALAKTRAGMIVIAVAVALSTGAVLIHRHNARIIEEHDRQGADEVQERVNEAIANGNALPTDPSIVQRNDRRCRDCR